MTTHHCFRNNNINTTASAIPRLQRVIHKTFLLPVEKDFSVCSFFCSFHLQFQFSSVFNFFLVSFSTVKEQGNISVTHNGKNWSCKLWFTSTCLPALLCQWSLFYPSKQAFKNSLLLLLMLHPPVFLPTIIRLIVNSKPPVSSNGSLFSYGSSSSCNK